MSNILSFTILIVSDNETVREGIENSFKDETVSFAFVSTNVSSRVLDIIYRQKPDIMLIDIDHANHAEAFDILTYLSPFDRDEVPPYLVLSNNIEDIEKSVILGAADFIKKPFDKKEVNIRVKSLLSLLKVFENISKIVEEAAKQFEKDEKSSNLAVSRNINAPMRIQRHFEQKEQKISSRTSHFKELKNPIITIIMSNIKSYIIRYY